MNSAAARTLILVLLLFPLTLFGSENQSQPVQSTTTAATSAGKTKSKNVSPTMFVTARASGYFNALMKGLDARAISFIEPSSRDRYQSLKYGGVQKFEISSVVIGKDEQTATVSVRATRIVPGMTVPFDLEYRNQWKRINNNWYLVAPSDSVRRTPFGTPIGGGSGYSEKDVMRKAEQAYRNVDPDQYYKALRKIDADQKEEQALQFKTAAAPEAPTADSEGKKADQAAEPSPK